MKKKGFTLIELLAVIVILAIIALISVPVILNMIDSAKKSGAKSSAYGYIEAIEYNNGLSEVENSGYIKVEDGIKEVNSIIGLKMKGKAPTSGTVTIKNGKVESANNLCINGYKVSYKAPEVTSVVKSNDCYANSSEIKKVWNIKTDSDENGNADVGDLICISTECFYVINNDGTNVTALAQYNLLVGSSCTGQYQCTEINNATGVQDPTAIGFHTNYGSSSPNIGVTAFSSENYWNNNTTIDITDSRNYLNKYLTNYSNYLTTLGSNLSEMTLMKKEEIESLIFDYVKIHGKTTLSNESIINLVPEWVYSSSYWLRSSEISNTNRIYCVSTNGMLQHTYGTSDGGGINAGCGVRPVITIQKSSIK